MVYMSSCPIHHHPELGLLLRYGYSLCSILRKAVVSPICSMPQIQAKRARCSITRLLYAERFPVDD